MVARFLFVGFCRNTAGEQQCGYNIFKNNIQWIINSSKEANISHHCSRSRERFAFPLPQALSVFLINSQSFPLFPPHPDPQLPPLILWKGPFLQHPATVLLVRPARGHITFQLRENHSCLGSHLDSTEFKWVPHLIRCAVCELDESRSVRDKYPSFTNSSKISAVSDSPV